MMIQIRNLGASHSDMHLFILLCDLFNYESSLSSHNCYAQETVVSLLEIKKSKFDQDMWSMVSEDGPVLSNIKVVKKSQKERLRIKSLGKSEEKWKHKDIETKEGVWASMPEYIIKLKNNCKEFLNNINNTQVPCILLHPCVSSVPHLTLKSIINGIEIK